MTTTTEKRYYISRRAPQPVQLSDFGIDADPDAPDRKIETIIRGYFTVAEYAAMFGSEADITDYMVKMTWDEDGWSINVQLADVLAMEREERSMQYALINALRVDQNQSPLNGQQAADISRGYREISPDASEFLLDMYDYAMLPEDLNMAEQVQKAKAAGLTLADFCKV